MKISALILVKNEEEMIEDAIRQLEFADEIIVLDQGSEDKTVKIAKKYTPIILSTKLEDFDKNRNLLASSAKGEWLLYIDADERLSGENIKEIKNVVRSANYSAYYFPRENYILGKFLRHGGWWPDYVPRLFKKSEFLGWKGRVHESAQIKGSFGYLENPIIHNTARSMSAMLGKSTKWAKVEADLYYKAGVPNVTILKLLTFSLSEFVSRYFLKLGFLDGKAGLISAAYQALHRVMILTYLWELQHKTKEAFGKIEYE